MKEKAEHIKRHSALASIASQLTLCGVDLNDEKSLESALNAFDTEAKTLYISEVVLAYLETEKGDDVIATCRKKYFFCCFLKDFFNFISLLCFALLQFSVCLFFSIRTPNSVFATYEMINPNDAFGKMMVTNLNVFFLFSSISKSKCSIVSLKFSIWCYLIVILLSNNAFK